MNKRFEAIKRDCDKVKEAKSKEKDRLTKTIATLDQDLNAVKSTLANALDLEDEELYAKADSEYKTKRAFKEMYETKLKELEEAPSLAKDEYIGLVNSIYTEIKNGKEKRYAELRDKLADVVRIMSELLDDESEAFELLKALQKMYNFGDCELATNRGYNFLGRERPSDRALLFNRNSVEEALKNTNEYLATHH